MSWIETNLGECCELYQPQTITTKDLIEDGKYLVYGANGVIGRYNKYNHEEPQLLVTCRGATCGAVNISSPYSWINGNAMVVKPKHKSIDSRFVEYFFRGAVDLRRAITGAAQPQITRQSLSPIKFQYPPIATQQKIVAKLDAIFAEIDTATATAEANAKNAEALFQSYLNEVFSSNENLTKLKDCTQIKPPKSEIKNLKGNTSVSFMPMESLGINDKFTISKQSKDLESVSGSYTYFTEGDVLLAKITPCFENGKLGIASNLVNGIGFGSSEYIVFRPNKIIDKEWLYYFLNRESFRVLGSQHMSGSVGHKRVTKEFIEETLIPLIPVAKQKEFVGKIDNVFLQSQILKSASKSKIRELTLLKQSILQKAFSGELVKD